MSLSDKALKETLDKMLLSGYFDHAQTHQNGVCEEETGAAAVESSESEEHPAEPGKNKTLTFLSKAMLPCMADGLCLYSLFTEGAAQEYSETEVEATEVRIVITFFTR